MKFHHPLLAACVAMLAAAACTSSPATPRFGELTVDTLVGQRPFDCKVVYRFATILNAAESPELAAIEQENIRYFFSLEEFSGSAQEAVAEALRQIAEDLASSAPHPLTNTPPWEPGELTVEAEGVVVDTLLSYVITRSSYTAGAAHGMYGTECHNYSFTGGYEITLSDLFPPEQLVRLTEVIRKKLYRQYDASSDEELTAKGFFPEYIRPTENFTVSEQGLTFCYNPYDIGCYALGAVEVTLSREELQGSERLPNAL